MTVNKGLKSLAESTPNFSNQALENSINELKIGWVAKSIELDTAITNNSVLTTTQKNDVKDTINNVACPELPIVYRTFDYDVILGECTAMFLKYPGEVIY